MDEPVKPVPYMERVLPWGETCNVVESKLKKMGLRLQLFQRARPIREKKGIDINDATYEAMCEYKEALDAGENYISENDERFIETAREGLMMDLPRRAPIEKELDWVGANMHRSFPHVQSAPSLFAISFIIDARLDPKIRAAFWSTAWSKRLSPGDGKSKPKAAVKEETEDDGQEVQLEELMGRLGMGE